jgi:hypothetical protein
MDVLISTALLIGKWVFIGLIYLALFIVLIAVRHEMRLRLGGPGIVEVAAPGRLRIRNPGSDPRLKEGGVFLLQNETSMGADPQNDLVLDDRYVSNHHARMRWDGAQWWIEDLGSKNGTFVQDRQAAPNVEQIVPFGAVIRVGGLVFELLE